MKGVLKKIPTRLIFDKCVVVEYIWQLKMLVKQSAAIPRVHFSWQSDLKSCKSLKEFTTELKLTFRHRKIVGPGCGKADAKGWSRSDHTCPRCVWPHSTDRRGYLAPVLCSPGLRHRVLHLHLYSLNWLWQWTQAWLKNNLLLVNTGRETHVLNMGYRASPLAIRMGSHVRLTLSHCSAKRDSPSFTSQTLDNKFHIPIHIPFSRWKMKTPQTSVFWRGKDWLASGSMSVPQVFFGGGELSSLAEFEGPKERQSPPSYHRPHTDTRWAQLLVGVSTCVGFIRLLWP